MSAERRQGKGVVGFPHIARKNGSDHQEGGNEMEKRIKKGALGIALAVVLVGGAFGGGEWAMAQEFPKKAIEIVIPWPTGGRTDLGARMLAPFLEKNLKVPVVVINKVGGGGLIAYDYLRDAKPDGYTLSYGGQGVGMYQYTKPEGVSLWHYTWLAQVYWTPMVVAVNSKSPLKNIKDLVDYARANPGKLRHGNTGTGSSTHIASEGFAKKSGIKFTQVPYKGEGDTVKGIGSGEVDVAFGLYVAFRPLVESGHLRIIGVADKVRNSLYPQIPTCAEQGTDFSSLNWEAIFMPKGQPKNVYDTLSNGLNKILHDPELKERYAKIGLNLMYRSGPEFTEYLKSWDREMKEIIFELNLQHKK